MKHKICISVDEETIIKIREGIRKGLFRNKSHAFEFAVNEVMGE
jgi:Arc/MetJ-type ribon-helix-helix transcriptional regulator